MLVLVLLGGTYYSNTVAVGPVYPDRASYDAAGSAYVEVAKKKSGMPERTGWVCIPAPPTPQPTIK